MKSKPIIAFATLLSLSCFYIMRFKEQAVRNSTPRDTAIDSKALREDVRLEHKQNPSAPEEIPDISTKTNRVFTKHLIQPNVPTTIYGKDGTVLFFPANCFVDESGQLISEAVEIKLEECYSLPQMISAKLSTTSDGRLLETAGMVNIEAFVGDRIAMLAKDASYTIYFPTKEKTSNDYQLFYGEWEMNGIINWKEATPVLDTMKDVSTNNSLEASVNSESTFGNKAPNISAPVYQTVLSGNDKCFLQITESYLRRGTRVSEMDYFNWRLVTGETLNQWFLASFNPDLEMLDQFCVMNLRSEITFKVNPDGSFLSYYISESSTPEYDRKLAEVLRSMPSLDLNQLMPRYVDDHACILAFSNKQSIEAATFSKAIKEKFEKSPNAKIEGIDESTLDYFVFSSSKLGWINCDRFTNYEGELVNYSIRNYASDHAMVSLVFDDMNSILRGINDGDSVHFYDVPARKKVRLIGIDNPNKSPVMCASIGQTSEKSRELKLYKPFTLKELEEQFVAR